MANGQITQFIQHHYRHFNAATLVDAAQAYRTHLEGGGQMMITLAGAMSTAELGLSLAEMIRADKVHAISCTGANLEEDVFNLVAHDFYVRVPHYRELSAQDELDLRARDLYRVTDTCIPEDEAMKRIEGRMIDLWNAAEASGERLFPHEFFYRLLDQPDFAELFQIDPANSWMVAAKEKNLPAFRSRLGRFDARKYVRRALHSRRSETVDYEIGRGIHDRTRRLLHALDNR
jgi:deoxyhypusine synthase